MKLKDITNFGKSIYQQGKEILSSHSTPHRVITSEHPKDETPLFDDEFQMGPEQEKLVKKFEIPSPDDPIESARQQSMLDSQGIANKADYQGLGRVQGRNSNMSQRNFENHQQT